MYIYSANNVSKISQSQANLAARLHLINYIKDKHKNNNNISNSNFQNILKLFYRVYHYLHIEFNKPNRNSMNMINDETIIKNVPGCTRDNLNKLKEFIKIINDRSFNFTMPMTFIKLYENSKNKNLTLNTNFEIYKNMKQNTLFSFLRENPKVEDLFMIMELNDDQIYRIVKLFQ